MWEAWQSLDEYYATREGMIDEDKRKKWSEEGDQLLKWRERLGLSRKFIAQKTGVDYGRLSRLEQGKPVREAKLIAQLYKMTLENVEIVIRLEKLLECFEINQLNKR